MKPGMKSVFVVAVAIGLAGYEAAAKPGDLLRTFLNPTPDPNDYFGVSVAAVGNNVIVGVLNDDTGGSNVGAAYLFNGSTGALLMTYANPTPAYDDHFGNSVAAAGSNVLIGANFDDTGARDAGAAYLFDGSTGALLRTFENPRPGLEAYFGNSVAAVGNNVLVGAPHASAGATHAGAAYLFDGSTGALLTTFQKPIPGVEDYLGRSVAALGTNVLVGAWCDDTGGTNAGAAYLFDGSTGALLQTFLKPAPEAHDHFGFSVAAIGSNVLVGARSDDAGATDAGAAYLFDGSTGVLLQTFLNPTPGEGDYFGCSVGAVGNNVLVGAYLDDTGASNAGAAYLFDGSTGALLQTFLNPTPGTDDYFGWSVAAVGSNVLVGAYRDKTGAFDAGAVYLFEGIPEPATLSLLALGGLAVLRRRRRGRRRVPPAGIVAVVAALLPLATPAVSRAEDPYQIAWKRQIGTLMIDDSRSVAIDGSGNAFIAGNTDGSLGGPSAGSQDAFLVKYDVSGNLTWARQLGTAYEEFCWAVAADASGNAYITGWGAGTIGQASFGNFDAFVVKYDGSGNIVWARQVGTSRIDTSHAVAVDRAGNVYISGETYGSLGGSNAGGCDAMLTKYDASGNKVWSRQFGTSYDDTSESVAVDASGNIYIGGWINGDLGAGGYSDAFLAKYDASGNRLWWRQIGSPAYDYGHSVAVDASGNVYFTGWTEGDLGGTWAAGGRDAFLCKYDGNGNRLWMRQVGGPYTDYGYSVAVDAAGNAYITGEVFSGVRDGFLTKFDTVGNVVWSEQFGDPASNETCFSVALDPLGRPCVSGWTNGTYGGATAGGYDAFVVKFIPEPATLSLLALGGLAVMRRREEQL